MKIECSHAQGIRLVNDTKESAQKPSKAEQGQAVRRSPSADKDGL